MRVWWAMLAVVYGVLGIVFTVHAKDILHADSVGTDGCPAGASATYQPGQDDVVPADLTPPMTIDFGKTTTVEPYLNSSNPAINQTRVGVQVSGLNEAVHPPCIPAAPERRN